MHEPATYPPLESVTIRIQSWDKIIIAFPNPSVTGKPFVTVIDVLERVFRAGQDSGGGPCGPVGVDLLIEPHFDRGQDLGVVMGSRGDLPTVGLSPFALNQQRDLTVSADHRTGEPMGTKRWRWKGLKASVRERDVWDLALG